MSATGTTALRPRLLGRATVNAVVAISVLYTLLPVLWLVLAAAKNRDALFGSDLLSLSGFSFGQNLTDLFAMDGGLYGRWYVNSLLYAVLGAAVGALISVACGYAFDKYRFRHKEKLFGLVLAAVMVPQTVLALPLYLMASEAGLVNTFWAVFIPVLFNPFGVYLGRIFSQGYVPDEVLEAARIDGSRRTHHVRAGRAADARTRTGHRVPVPAHRHLEQLLPAHGDALRPGPVPGQPRPVRVEQLRVRLTRVLPRGHHGIAARRGAADPRLRPAPALLAQRSHHAAP